MNKTYFVSGHTDYDVKEFIRDYVPMLTKAIEEGATFLVGDNDGVEAMTQSFLKQNLKDLELGRVKVFHKGETPKNFMSTEFFAVPGFGSDLEMYAAMTLCSDEDIVCIKPNRENSLIARNVIRRYTPEFNFKEISESFNNNKDFWNMLKENN